MEAVDGTGWEYVIEFPDAVSTTSDVSTLGHVAPR
jgi:hypothetical protein